MGLRGSLVGTVAFGLTAGLLAVVLHQAGWDLGGFSWWFWIPALAAVALAALSIDSGRPLFLLGTSVGLLLAGLPLLDETTWVLPVAGALLVLLAIRLRGSLWFTTRWLVRGYGAFAAAWLAWALFSWLGRDGALTTTGPDWLLPVLLAGLVVAAWWPSGGSGRGGGQADEEGG